MKNRLGQSLGELIAVVAILGFITFVVLHNVSVIKNHPECAWSRDPALCAVIIEQKK